MIYQNYITKICYIIYIPTKMKYSKLERAVYKLKSKLKPDETIKKNTADSYLTQVIYLVLLYFPLYYLSQLL